MAGPGRWSESVENYVKTVAVLQGEGSTARVRDIAARLGVKGPSVTGAVAQLVQLGLANHPRYGGVELTQAGHELAARVLRRHQTLVRFLHEVLGVSARAAEADACRLEHAMSGPTFRAFEAFVASLLGEKEGVAP